MRKNPAARLRGTGSFPKKHFSEGSTFIGTTDLPQALRHAEVRR
jgi:hypothetical protein